MLKTCINSIKSKNGNGDQQETVRSSQFLDELNALISSASNLTKSLDKVEHGYKKKATSNGSKEPQIKEESKELSTTQGDVDMTEYSDSNNNNTEQLSADNKAPAHSNKSKAGNCDFKDVILCNLIDDFLLKENEF